MNFFQTIHTVAKFERITLLRSWFFRIFAALFIIGLGIFNIAVFVESSDSPWIFRALPASLPYANLIILNLGQAIVAVFLASEFLKQDKKNDSAEVIYVRPMANFEYITGKTLGIISVFIILNFIILIIGIGFSFLSGDSAKGIAEFILYPILISIPTLTFILGLSFFLMTILRNQAITFILLLGYIAISVFYLNEKCYHLFDYIAYNVPMLSSTIGGFGNLTEIFMHRGIYFLIGIGLILFTVFKIQRLPQSNRFKYLPLVFAFAFIGSGFYIGYRYIALKKGVIEEKKQMIELNNKYAFCPRVYVDECTIDLDHTKTTIKVCADLKVINKGNKVIDSLILSLNPSLKISKIEIDGKDYSYTRELHLIKIKDGITIYPDETKNIVLHYAGKINENTHFLDINPDEYVGNLSLGLYNARKRFAYIEKNFVCLTSESLWYPIAGVTYASDRPAYYMPDFTRYSLKVRTRENLTAISQGEVDSTEKGVYKFTNKQPLPKISLLIGDYSKQSVTVDSVEYSLFTIKGNDYYLKQFTDIQDTLPTIIRELKNEFENLLDLKYGFQRFTLAEVPVNFAIDRHIWTAVSDAVQPEIIFYPEKGIIMGEADFRKRMNSFEKRMKSNNEEVTPEELQCRILKQFVRRNLMTRNNDWIEFGNIVNKFTYSIIPQFYTHVTHLDCEDWPILNLAMEVYLCERNITEMQSRRWSFRGITNAEKINLELKQSSLKDLLAKGYINMYDEEDAYNPLSLNDIVLTKGDYLFSLLRTRFGEKEFNSIINKLIANNQHKPLTFYELEQSIKQEFNHLISTQIDDWYTTTQMPGFLIKDLQTYKVADGEFIKYQVRFSISNPEPADGIALITINLDDKSSSRSFTDDKPRQPDYFNRVLIPAGTAQEIGVLFQTEPKQLNISTGISENMPNILSYELTGFDEIKKMAQFSGFNNIPMFSNTNNKNDIIVDNEDEGFSYIQESNESYLKSLLNKNKQERYKYSGINFWNPSTQWKSVLQSNFYGRYVRSALYTASGDGSRYVQWKANLPQGAYYDVYCHMDIISSQRNRNERESNYNFRIYHDDGVEDITLAHEELENGWNYMGTFYISPENAKVELTNKSVGKMIFADAIKWIKNE